MKKILYTALGALMLTACQKEATDLPQLGNYPEDGVVRIATQLNAIQTRVGEPTIYAGGNLSLSVDYGTGDKYTVYNSQWTNSSNVWSTATQMLWKNATAEAKIYAYAPFVDLGATPNITAVPFSVAADQSAGLTSSDLVGYKDETFIPGSSLTTKKELNIAFAHKLAKLKVALTFGDQFGGSNPTITSVTIGGTLPATTYNATTAELVGTASGTATNIKTYANTAVAGITFYEAIIIPQVVAKDTRLVTITLDNGDSYGYTISATAGHDFKANTENTINLKIGKDKITLASPVQVNDWTTGTPLADGETELAPPAIGDYYYSDNTYSTDLNGTKTVLGVTFWTDPANPKHVKIVSLQEPPANWKGLGNLAGFLQWSPEEVETGAKDRDNGLACMRKIMEIADWQSKYPVFAYAHAQNDPSTTYADGSIDIWYLPAENELRALYNGYNGSRDAFNAKLKAANGIALAEHGYWAATEYNTSFALYVSLYDISMSYYTYKTIPENRVRLVRDIKVP